MPVSSPEGQSPIVPEQDPYLPIICTGIGYDVHRLVEGRRLVLGGVEIAHSLGLEGHSDADVLSHAVTDALLGAAGLGDIGQHFPPGDPAYKDISSLKLIHKVVALLAEKQWRIVNIDSVVVAERPKLQPFIGEMRQRLAEALGIVLDRVSVKATTTEGLGFAGRGEGIGAYAVTLLSKQK